MARIYIATDMDDTLISAYGTPTESVRTKWNELAENPEVCLIVATGQQFMKVKSTFLGNGLTLPDYIIADQGTVIYSTRDNRILKTFHLPTNDVAPIVQKFFDENGEKQFMRIYTPEMIFAYDCEIARKFFADTNQKNVLFGTNLEHIIENGKYTKVILMNTAEKVDRLVLHSLNSNTLMAVNTGETKYGNCHYHRFEIVSSNKKAALEYLLTLDCDFPNNEKPIELIGLGDEKSDFGLAQVAMAVNLYPDNTGNFVVVDTGTRGNEQLKVDVKNLATAIGYDNQVMITGNVAEDGWVSAISKLINK